MSTALGHFIKFFLLRVPIAYRRRNVPPCELSFADREFWPKRNNRRLLFLLILSVSCHSNKAQDNAARKVTADLNTPQVRNIAGNFSNQQLIRFNSGSTAVFFARFPRLNVVRKELDSFYYNRQYSFAWFDDKGMIEQAANLYDHIRNIRVEGVKALPPYTTEYASMMAEPQPDSADVNTEIMITAQYFLYAKDVWEGLSEKETTKINWYLPRKKISIGILLDSLLNGNDLLNNPPIYRQYALLKFQLQKYDDIRKSGGFPTVNIIKGTLKRGDSSAVVREVSAWLLVAGDLSEPTSGGVFEDTLAEGIRRFQLRMGLPVNGYINAALIKEMNVTADARIEQIIVNMERARWVPVGSSADYLVVNIPEFKLHAYEHDSLVWSMDAVVGKPLHKTVLFSGQIQFVVFSPYWNVPPSILKQEVLPKIRRNRHYLASQNMEWNNGGVRQRSGPHNALGLVKFMFPNSYNIYLHDTPAKNLFSESARAFSHGCIRLSDAEKMANYMLKNDTEWNAEKINAAMHLGKEKVVSLEKPEPVYIVYFTSWVDSGGRLNFRNDIYQRDKRLAAMLLESTAL